MAASGFFDLQVNGYGGVDFNQDDLDGDELRRACEALRADGVAGVLATFITEELDRMVHRVERLVALREADPLIRDVIAGIHLEGPFINDLDGWRGAHPRDAVRPARADDMRRLLDAGAGLVRVVTLAPERDPGLAVVRLLADAGVVASAGHCNPSLTELDAAIDAGLSMFTHLGNGCPNNLPRHFNIIQRVLSRSERLRIGFIADGVHIPLYALRNYLRAAGLERCFIVTDCLAAAGLGPGRFRLGRWDLEIGPDLIARSPDGSHLIGSAMPMKAAVRNLTRGMGLTVDDIALLTCKNPRLAAGCP
jgi:N-acetylglucosamine-6-phosphate deacetylase